MIQLATGCTFLLLGVTCGRDSYPRTLGTCECDHIELLVILLILDVTRTILSLFSVGRQSSPANLMSAPYRHLGAREHYTRSLGVRPYG